MNLRALIPHLRRKPLCCFVLALLLAFAPRASAAPPISGAIDFPVSCKHTSAEPFNRAVELLHSFEYPAARQSFQMLLERDPGCVMARWGVAMTLWHPLWAPPAEAELARGAELLEGIPRDPLTPRELGFIDALQAFYREHGSVSHNHRAARYRDLMGDLHTRYPQDLEVAIFYALALLATADPADKRYCPQFRAAGLLNWARQSSPNHPGVLHYLIHSYDYPGLAHLALDAAERYADVAPDSTHAQHMPSHIFTRLGMWRQAVQSNVDSTRSAAHYTEQAALPGHYDEGLHSVDYLMYALLQLGDDVRAAQLLEHLVTLSPAHPQTFKVAFTYAASPARFALERHQWREASQLVLQPREFPWQDFPWAESIHHFARGLGAARSGQIELARRELETLHELAKRLPEDTLPYWRSQVAVHTDAVAAWIALAQGQREVALQHARDAADREDGVDKHPVTPGEVLPARELLADLLMELGQGAEAARQYQRVLTSAPNRANALLGAARAHSAQGDSAAAADYYHQLFEQTAGSQREELRAAARRHQGSAP